MLLDDNGGAKDGSVEKKAIPNETLRGFDKIDLIKEELEQSCPGIVSCADILALPTRDGIVLAGGPFYSVLTGRRDSHQSFYEAAKDQIPRPDDKITQILHLFALQRIQCKRNRGHNIGSMGCEFIRSRLYNFQGTGRPDPSIPPDFLFQLRHECLDILDIIIKNDTENKLPKFIMLHEPGLTYLKTISSSVSWGSNLHTLLSGPVERKRTPLCRSAIDGSLPDAPLVSAYASDDGSTFRMDFARVMFKLSNLDVLTGHRGGIRINCSLPPNVF